MKLPKDCSSRVTGSEARKLVHYVFPSKNWEYHEATGTDHGKDCEIELIENNEWVNKKIEGQIKGTMNPYKLKGDEAFSVEIDVKTINYGLNSSTAFVLFYVDVKNEDVYYLPIQDYFISDKSLFDRLESNTTKMSVHVPCNNKVCDNDYELQQIAKSIYVEGPSRNIRKI